MKPPRDIVYVLRSILSPHRYYTSITSDVDGRLAAHNAGQSTHTMSGRPWALVVSIRFTDATKAEAFEGYLKSGSGRAFANRHFR